MVWRSYFKRVFPVTVVAIALVMIAVGPAVASEPVIDEMTVSIMPEYDDPRVLAVMEAKLAAEVALPYTAEFLVPISAANPEIGMACEVPEGQGHVCKAYQTKEVGDFRSVSYQVNQAQNLFFEYYWDPFTGASVDAKGRKSFKYEFKAPEVIKSLSIGIQEPLKAEEFSLDPAPAETVRDSDGLNVNIYNLSDVPKGEVITINANYVKTDPAVSKPRLNPGAPVAAATIGSAVLERGPLQQQLLLFIGMFLAAMGAVIFWRRMATPAPTEVKPVGKKNLGQACPACGSALKGSPRFCSNCGESV